MRPEEQQGIPVADNGGKEQQEMDDICEQGDSSVFIKVPKLSLMSIILLLQIQVLWSYRYEHPNQCYCLFTICSCKVLSLLCYVVYLSYFPPPHLHTAQDNQSKNPHNDYAQHFVDTGERSQNFIHDASVEDRFEEYPKLKELIQRKDEHIDRLASPPMLAATVHV